GSAKMESRPHSSWNTLLKHVLPADRVSIKTVGPHKFELSLRILMGYCHRGIKPFYDTFSAFESADITDCSLLENFFFALERRSVAERIRNDLNRVRQHAVMRLHLTSQIVTRCQ